MVHVNQGFILLYTWICQVPKRRNFTYLEDPGMLISPFWRGGLLYITSLGVYNSTGDAANSGGHVHVTCPRNFDVGNPCIIQPLDQVGVAKS